MTKIFQSEVLNVLRDRGFFNQHTDLEALDKQLQSGMTTVYCGFDATAKSLHVGHVIPTMMLYWMQAYGHRPIVLMGGGTTLLGDPSFKDKERPLLTPEDIAANITGIRKVFAKVMHFDKGENNDAIMVNNADWLTELGFIEFLRDYGKHISVNRMISMEAIKRRLSERDQGISLLEFCYTTMQGYDFVHLYREYDCRLQICGSDQWGNTLSGIDLGRRTEGVQLHALTAPLLTTSSGKKMGKSEGNAIWLDGDLLSPYEFYQFWRNTEDADVERFLKYYTILPLDEIAKLAALKGQEINEAKKVLAFEATKLIHGKDAALAAQDTAKATFESGQLGDDLPRITLSRAEFDGTSYVDLFVQAGLAESKGAARRLIKGGGARVNDTPISDSEAKSDACILNVDGTAKLSAGKKRHVVVEVTG